MSKAVEESDLTVLVFELDEHRYGIDASAVSEVVRAVQPTRLAQAPSIVEGAINVRGRVAALLDMRARFGLPSRPICASDVIILCEIQGRLIGLRVDRTVQLSAVSASTLAAASQVSSAARYVRGALALPDGLLLLCDLPAFLNEAEQLALGAALEAGARAEASQ